jgi:phosphoadenosine phosphosulfate reductase
MTIAAIQSEVRAKMDNVRAALADVVTGNSDVCLTCSFQAEDVLLTRLAIELDANLPVLFLDTGYHFAETYAYRDRIASEWRLNLINLLPEKTVAEQEAEHGLLYQSAPDQCCKLRKVEPLFKAVAGYRVWLTGLRWRSRPCSRFRAASRC